MKQSSEFHIGKTAYSNSLMCNRMQYGKIQGPLRPVPEVPCVPLVSGLHFFDASSESDRNLFKLIGYPRLTTSQLLTDFVIPNLEKQPMWLRYPLIEFIFDKKPLAGNEPLVRLLSDIPFVKVCNKNGREAPNRLKPSDVIDQDSILSNLYFDNEQVFGSGVYSSDGPYYKILSNIGMKSTFDAAIATERIQYYHNCNENNNKIFEKSGCLLTYLNSIEFNDEWLPLMRIPALYPMEALTNKSSFTPLSADLQRLHH